MWDIAKSRKVTQKLAFWEETSKKGGYKIYFTQTLHKGFQPLNEKLDVLVKNEFEDKLDIAIQIAQQLTLFHQLGLFHHDIAFRNLLWNEDTQKLELIDFGISIPMWKAKGSKGKDQDIDDFRNLLSRLHLIDEHTRLSPSHQVLQNFINNAEAYHLRASQIETFLINVRKAENAEKLQENLSSISLTTTKLRLKGLKMISHFSRMGSFSPEGFQIGYFYLELAALLETSEDLLKIDFSSLLEESEIASLLDFLPKSNSELQNYDVTTSLAEDYLNQILKSSIANYLEKEKACSAMKDEYYARKKLIDSLLKKSFELHFPSKNLALSEEKEAILSSLSIELGRRLDEWQNTAWKNEQEKKDNYERIIGTPEALTELILPKDSKLFDRRSVKGFIADVLIVVTVIGFLAMLGKAGIETAVHRGTSFSTNFCFFGKKDSIALAEKLCHGLSHQP